MSGDRNFLMTYFVTTSLVVLLARSVDKTVFGDRNTSLSSTTGGAAVAGVERNTILGIQMNTWR